MSAARPLKTPPASPRRDRVGPQERRRIEVEVQQLEAFAGSDRSDPLAIERDLRARVEEWRQAAARNVTQGRLVLRKLLRGRVNATPRDNGTWELSGHCDYGKLFSGISLATAMASPMPPSWNQIVPWLRQIDALRQAA